MRALWLGRERPIRYGWVERIVDRRNGSRDGRAGLPNGEVGAVTMPTVNELVYLFQERAAREYWLMTQATKNRRASIADLEQQMVNQWGRLHAHYSRRIMSYMKRLYLVHPDGQYLQANRPDLGQRELEDALHKLFDLTGARHLRPAEHPRS